MKVGILTFHFADSIGAVLNAYALQTTLQQLGVKDVGFINFVPSGILDSYKLLPSIRVTRYDFKNISSALKEYPIRLILRIIDFHGIYERTKKFREFRRKYLNIVGKAFEGVKTLREMCEKFDICIVGSDQVWNPYFLGLSDFGYLLPFELQNTEKIAYAASITKNIRDIPKNLLEIFKKHLSSFSAISVRERLTSVELSKFLGREVYHTLDPTLLLDQSDYEKIIEENCNISLSPNYILVYNVLGYRNANELFKLDRIAKELSDKVGASIVKIGLGLKRHHVNPSEFLWLLKNANFVITNSYHGVVLSIIFKKKFLVMLPSLRKLRIVDLLKTLGIGEKAVFFRKSFEDIDEGIDYDLVGKLLRKYKNRSLNFLKTALKL